jgi:branched-chain amino acid transport system ATP-binding protein
VSGFETTGLSSGYAKTTILRDVDVRVEPGEVVGILGANGAGKTTLLRAIAGALPAFAGHILWEGRDITKRPAWWRARNGIAHVPEGRQLFAAMTVVENLSVAGRHARDPAARLRSVYELFPKLAQRARQRAGSLSGGEQQMVAIGRALMTDPRLLLVDELSAGLAPIIAEQLVEALAVARAAGTAILVVEQSPYLIADLVDRVHVVQQGRVVASGPLAELGGPDAIAAVYLGEAAIVT